MNNWKAALLTVTSSIGIVGTAYLTAKATVKAQTVIAEAEKEKGEALTKEEVIKVAAPSYIPAVTAGIATIACIIGCSVLNGRYQAQLLGAYALLDKSYREYRSKVDDLYGEDADNKVSEELAKDHYEEDVITTEVPEGQAMFFDTRTLRYFYANLDDVIDPVEMDDGRTCYVISTPYDEWAFGSPY